jgi:NUMOD3 motif
MLPASSTPGFAPAIAPYMNAASFPVPQSARSRGMQLPRLDRVLSDAARAAMSARRLDATMSPESRRKIGETAARNRQARAARIENAARKRDEVAVAQYARKLRADWEFERDHALAMQSLSMSTQPADDPPDALPVSEEDPTVVETIAAQRTKRGAQNAGGGKASSQKSAEKLPGPAPSAEELAANKAEIGRKISLALKGRTLSEERKAKISASLKGRTLSDAHRAKLSERFLGESNPMFGRRLSAESRAKISSALLSRRTAQRNLGVKHNSVSDSTSEQIPGTEANLDDKHANIRKPRVRRKKAVPVALKDKAMRSRLLTSGTPGHPNSEKQLDEEAALEDLLARVAAGQLPPQAVERMRADAQQAASRAARLDAAATAAAAAAKAAAEAAAKAAVAAVAAAGQLEAAAAIAAAAAASEVFVSVTTHGAQETADLLGDDSTSMPDVCVESADVDVFISAADAAALQSTAAGAAATAATLVLDNAEAAANAYSDSLPYAKRGRKSGASAVEKARQSGKSRLQNAGLTKPSTACTTCSGPGSVECAHCVGKFGIASRHCTSCVGAGIMFCPQCSGSGVIEL